jgi:uridine kinase
VTLDSPARPLTSPPVILAVAGASGSGKSTLAAELARSLGGLHFSLDTYYRDLSHLPREQRPRVNFDDPGMIEAPLLESHIRALSEGRAIERPLYSFSEYIRIPGQTETVVPGGLVVVEGLFATYYPELRPFYHLSIYVDTTDDMCYARRLKRDVEERGRVPESVRQQYDATVRPCGLAFVRPLIDFADLVIDGSDPLDFKIELIVNTMRKRGLLSKVETAREPHHLDHDTRH